jgi:hypothetical protein
VASFPLGPSKAFPTFLLDFRVFPGNSGGPVYLERPTVTRSAAAGPAAADQPLIAGMLTQQVEVGSENLGIGIVTQAQFIRETVAELDQSPAVADAAVRTVGNAAVASASAVAHTVADHTRAVSVLSFATEP